MTNGLYSGIGWSVYPASTDAAPGISASDAIKTLKAFGTAFFDGTVAEPVLVRAQHWNEGMPQPILVWFFDLTPDHPVQFPGQASLTTPTWMAAMVDAQPGDLGFGRVIAYGTGGQA